MLRSLLSTPSAFHRPSPHPLSSSPPPPSSFSHPSSSPPSSSHPPSSSFSSSFLSSSLPRPSSLPLPPLSSLPPPPPPPPPPLLPPSSRSPPPLLLLLKSFPHSKPFPNHLPIGSLIKPPPKKSSKPNRPEDFEIGESIRKRKASEFRGNLRKNDASRDFNEIKEDRTLLINMKEGSIRKKPTKYKSKQRNKRKQDLKKPFFDFPSENSDSDSMDNLSKELVYLSTAQKMAAGWRTCPLEMAGESLDARKRDSNKFLGELAERLIREEEVEGRKEEGGRREEEEGRREEGGTREKVEGSRGEEGGREEGGGGMKKEDGVRKNEGRREEERRVGRRKELIEKVGEMWRMGEVELGHRILFEFFDRLSEEDFKGVVLKLAGRGNENEKKGVTFEPKEESRKEILTSKRKEEVKSGSNDNSERTLELPDPHKVLPSKNNTSKSKDPIPNFITNIKSPLKTISFPSQPKTELISHPLEAIQINHIQSSPKKPEAPSSSLPPPILPLPSSRSSPPPSPHPLPSSNPPPSSSSNPPPSSSSLPPPLPSTFIDPVPSSLLPSPSISLPLTPLPTSSPPPLPPTPPPLPPSPSPPPLSSPSLLPPLSKANPPPTIAIPETPKFSNNMEDNPFIMVNVKPKGLADFFGGLNAPTNQGSRGGEGLGVETGRNEVTTAYQRGVGGLGGGGVGGMGGGIGGGMGVGLGGGNGSRVGGLIGGGGMTREGMMGGIGGGSETSRNGVDKNELFTFRNNMNTDNKDDLATQKNNIHNIFGVTHQPRNLTHIEGMEIEDFFNQRTPDNRNNHPSSTPFFQSVPNPNSISTVPTNQMEIISNPNPNLTQSTIFQAKISPFPFGQSTNNLLFQGQHQNTMNLFNKNEGNNGLIGISTPNSMFPSNLNIGNDARGGNGMLNSGNNGPPFFSNGGNTSQNLFNLRKNEQEQKSPFSHVQSYNIFQNDTRNEFTNATPNTPTFMNFQNNNPNFQQNTPFFTNSSNLNTNNNNFFDSTHGNSNNIFNNVDKNFALSLFDKKADALKSNSTPNSLSLFSNDDRQKNDKPKPIDPTLERMLKKGQNKPLRLNP